MRTRLIKATECAAKYGMSVRWWYDNYERLSLMPVKVAAGRKGLRWVEREVDRDIERRLDARSRRIVSINRILRREKVSA